MVDEEGSEVDESDVTLSFGEVNEDDLQIISSDIQEMVIAPTDWTISVLVDLLKRKKIQLDPQYQRRIAWDDKKMSRFIESLFLRLPVPQIVLAELSPGRFAVIDGKQRINSLARFCIDVEHPLSLKDCEYRPDLNDKTYGQIEEDINLEASLDSFQSHTVRTVVVKNWKSDSVLYLLFLRLNQNSVTLSPQELRRAMFPGVFLNWLDDKTSSSEGMKVIFNKVPDFRMRDMEIATRFFAFRRFSSDYQGNMKKFLDGATEFLTRNFDDLRDELESEWLQYELSIDHTKAIFGKDAFRSRAARKYQGSKNRAVMDIMTFYFSFDAVRLATKPHFEQIKEEFELLCDNDSDFSNALQTSTKSVRATSRRFHTWSDKLAEISSASMPDLSIPREPDA